MLKIRFEKSDLSAEKKLSIDLLFFNLKCFSIILAPNDTAVKAAMFPIE